MHSGIESSLQKAFFGVLALGVSCIAIELIPLSRQATYWNRCFDSTVSWINEAQDLKEWNQNAKESLAVGVCNGAVYEPKLQTN
ncbi:hypothetical protein [Prochlorococcus marinus]|uniref:hypothetical protein n=1 Tax=Prochlorococcus marinus TaxID=1219 RepID=UPI0022B434F2|nr:hypothetical protein [Prochlorococcus marinus]